MANQWLKMAVKMALLACLLSSEYPKMNQNLPNQKFHICEPKNLPKLSKSYRKIQIANVHQEGKKNCQKFHQTFINLFSLENLTKT